MTSPRYALEFAPKALRALRKLDRPVVERIQAATESLREDPRPAGAKMLTGMHGVLRIRIAGDDHQTRWPGLMVVGFIKDRSSG